MYRVTVIMPVYNGEKYLEQAINSILQQTYKDFELLLIDDASTDRSIEIIKQYTDNRIRLVTNEVNMGIAGTRNRGLELSNTEYIALMDDDDIAVPNRLELEVQYLDKNPDVDVVGGHLRRIDREGNDINKQWSVYLNPSYIKAYLLLGNTIANGTAMFRKEFVDKFNIRYQDYFYGAEDYRFWVECSLNGKIANLDKVLLYWRTGHNNETGRVINNQSMERINAINKIHTYALEQTGFRLSNNEISLLNHIFEENGIIENNTELEALYCILKKISEQAKELGVNNAKEVATMCRKRFGEKVGKAFYLWE